eukprot:1143062-Pelagomonas_calceolata.AAC.4
MGKAQEDVQLMSLKHIMGKCRLLGLMKSRAPKKETKCQGSEAKAPKCLSPGSQRPLKCGI